ncbi:MAG: ABC transporter permease [Corynebacterium sp.]|uniref:ABC transporter permease n=1 Tax=Corynebacterium sp. TaxID=1720 RepID=UPI0026E01CA7|nr:ABC transporter permease [Corynebacterium sp.]MDO5671033.1 ABC transporter permease [Corynebacterium sp.]
MTSLGILQKISLRSLAAHKLRFIMTMLAVVLGTSFVAGGFILTASLSKAFDDISSAQFAGADLVLNYTPEYPLTLEMAEEISERADVDKVETLDMLPVVILGPDNAAYQSGGAGSWILPWTPPEDSIASSTRIGEGRAPEAAGEAVINSSAAERADLAVGDTVTVIDPVQRAEYTLVGLSETDMATGGWAGLQVVDEVFRTEYSPGGTTGSMLVQGDVALETLRAAYPGAEILTAAEAAEQTAEDINQALSFFTYVLLAFGLIALLVGTFIISNTFSMIVGQRTREFALLRALGMSRLQLTGSVLVEAALVGVVGSALGIVVGVGLVKLIVYLMEAFGLGFPNAGVGLDARSILVPLVVGIVVTLVSAFVPARRAGRVHPVQAMRSGDQSSTQPVAVRSILGGIALVAGLATSLLAALVSDWSTSTRTLLLGIGAVALILGALLLLAGVARYFFAWRRGGAVVPLLARTNLSRNPRRTAATAFALTLGVALVCAVGILGASIKLSVFGAIEEELTADAVVSAGVVTNQSIPAQALHTIEDMDGVEGIVTVSWVPLSVDGKAGSRDESGGVSAVLDHDPTRALNLEVVEGSFAGAGSRPGVGLSVDTARELGVGVGDSVPITSSVTTLSTQAPVVVIWENSSSYTPLAISAPTVEEFLPDRSTWFTQTAFVRFSEEADTEAVFRQVSEEAASYGVLQAMTPTEYQLSAAAQIDQLLAIVYALLALSVVIAVLGIVNTLGLSIMERAHEFGMLRAVGMQQRQVRRMITLESVYIAVVGAVTGILSGTWLGWCLVKTQDGQGINRWAIPWEQLAVVLVTAVLVGIIAALWPARRAARTSPLAAVE